MERERKFEIPKEKEQALLNDIIAFFQSERDEEIGLIGAGEVLDFFLDRLGDDIYKKGIQDATKLMKEQMDSLEVELALLSEK